MFRNILGKLGNKLLMLATIGTEQAESKSDQATALRGFDPAAAKWAAARRDPSAAVTASSVEIIGLAEIEKELGPGWTIASEKAREIAERTIKKRLVPGDVYTRRDNGTYVICFADLNKREAAQITKAIVDEIRALLSREASAPKSLSIAHHVAELDAATFLDSSGSVLDAVAKSLDAVRQEAEEAYERQRRMLLEDASAIFCPTWSPARRYVILHRCLLDDWTSRFTLQTLSAVAEAGALQEAVADLDYLLLGKAIGTLHSILPSANKTILLVPVNFLTLGQRKSRDQYVALCQKIPAAYRKFLLLEIYGIPPQTTAGRMLATSQGIQTFFNAVIFSFQSTEVGILFELSANGVYGISITYDDLEEENLGLLERYVAAAKAANLRSFVYGVKTTGQLKHAIEAGADYISGEAIAPKTEAPRAAYAWSPLDLSASKVS